MNRAKNNQVLSRLIMAVLSVALVFTMMPLSMGFAFAEDTPADTETAAVLTVTGDNVSTPLSYSDIKTLKNDTSIKPLIKENVSFHTVNSSGTEEDFTVTGVTIEDLINLAGLKEKAELVSVTATADDGYAKTYTAEQILKADLQGNKAMFIWTENGEKVQKTAVGQFTEGENNKSLWVKGNTITLTITAEVPSVFSVTGDDLNAALKYDSIKTLKNDENVKPLIKDATFHTMNKAGKEEDIAVTGVTIEELINLAGLKEGMELDSVTATANDGFSKTYTADQILNEDLQGNKAMFIWSDNGEKVQEIAIGQFTEGEINKSLWVSGDTIALTVTAKVGAVTLKAVKAGKKKATVKWEAIAAGDGYEVYRATKKNGKYSLATTIDDPTTVKYVNKKLKKGKTYFFKVRAFKNGETEPVYGDYSAVKKVKVK